MIAFGKRLFQKFLRQYPISLIRGFPLTGPDGSVLGYIDDLRYYTDRVYINGWCTEGELTLVVGRHRKPVLRTISRPDVSGQSPHLADLGPLGFEIESVWNGDPVALVVALPPTGNMPDDKFTIHPPVPGSLRRRAHHVKALARFAMVSAMVAPGVALRLMRGQKIDYDTLRRRFGLKPPAKTTVLMDQTMFADTGTSGTVPETGITIVLPVYNAFDLLREALRRVEAHTELPWHLIVVEDCSPDTRVRPWLRDWADARQDRVTLLENEVNLGFIGSVNRAFSVTPADQPLVLLNSDALVPQNWAGRLIAPLLADPMVASVTPMSNDATLFSVPIIGLSRGLPEGLADDMDVVAQSLSCTPADPAPTGVGFCMAMSPAARSAIPQFDTAFGKGYGEEVDWCQRARMLGMQHLGVGNLFVEHRGGQSFGNDVKTAAMRAGGRIISSRYPSFDQEVQDYIARDPLLPARLALGLAWAAGVCSRGDARVPIYIGHSLGGGAESWLKRAVASEVAEDRPVVVLRLGGENRFRVELHTSDGVIAGETNDSAVLKRLMAPLAGHRFIYSCGVGDRAAIEIPSLILSLAGPDGEIRILFHDYWPISPSYTLVDSDNVFRGVPDRNTTDTAHQSRDASGHPVTLAQWRDQWGQLVAAAQELVVFSDNSAGIVLTVWPDAADRLIRRTHKMNIPDLTVRDARWLSDTPGTIAVLGGIGIYKGADYISKTAAAFVNRADAPKLVIIGEFDLSFPLPASVTVTGRYNVDDLPALIARHRIQAWLMPSVVPETFSFATHEMLATGLPVLSFALGAQGDAVAKARQGYILPDEKPETLLETFRRATGKRAG